MTVRALLRTAAFLTAGAAVIDPIVPVRGSAPVPVAVRAMRGTSDTQVRNVRDRLSSALKTSVNLDPVERPAALVLIGDRPDADSLPDNLPISTVGIVPSSGPNIRIVSASDPQPVLPGWTATVKVVVEGTGVAGTTGDVVLEQNGIQMGSVSHTWSQASEQFTATFSVPLAEAGVSIFRVWSKPGGSETTLADNGVDLRAVAESRVLKVAAYDPRPSWGSAFVRRVLEADPTFEVSTIVRASKGLEVRAGSPPAVLTASGLEPFDLVVVGAPEELTAGESEALSAFARERGGAVLLLPDRRPAGPFLALVGASGFDEMLLDKPVNLEVPAGAPVRASEFALPRTSDTATVLAAVDQGSSSRPAIVSTPAGRGRIIFSGALDAWRFRDSNDDAYSGFWRHLAAVAAVAAPRRLELSVHPGIATPGTSITVRAEVRRTEIGQHADRSEVPPIAASVIAGDGSATGVRLWPTAEAGVFEGRFEAGSQGQYDIRASLDGRVTADTPLVIRDNARMLVERDDEGLRLVAQATGGVTTSVDNLQPLESYLASLPKARTVTQVHVMRSLWWMVAFVSLLCAEWTLRRRQGDK